MSSDVTTVGNVSIIVKNLRSSYWTIKAEMCKMFPPLLGTVLQLSQFWVEKLFWIRSRCSSCKINKNANQVENKSIQNIHQLLDKFYEYVKESRIVLDLSSSQLGPSLGLDSPKSWSANYTDRGRDLFLSQAWYLYKRKYENTYILKISNKYTFF